MAKLLSEEFDKQTVAAGQNATPINDNDAIEYWTQEEEDAAYNQPEQSSAEQSEQAKPVQAQPVQQQAQPVARNNYSVEGQEARNQEIFKKQTSAHDRYMMGRRQAAETNPNSFSQQERQTYLNYQPYSWTKALQEQELHDMDVANQKTQMAIAKNKEVKEAEDMRNAQYDMAVGDQVAAAFADMNDRGVIKTNKKDKKRYRVGTVAGPALAAANPFIGAGGRDKVTKILCYQAVDDKNDDIGKPNFLIEYKRQDGKTVTRTMSLGQVMTEMKKAQMAAGHAERNVNNYVIRMFGYNNPMGWDDVEYYSKDVLDYKTNETKESHRHQEAETAEKNKAAQEASRIKLEEVKEKNRAAEAEAKRAEEVRQFDATNDLEWDKQDLDWHKQEVSEEQFDKNLQAQIASAIRTRQDKVDAEREKQTFDLVKSAYTLMVDVPDPENKGKTKKVPWITTLSKEQQNTFMNYIYQRITPGMSDEEKKKLADDFMKFYVDSKVTSTSSVSATPSAGGTTSGTGKENWSKYKK